MSSGIRYSYACECSKRHCGSTFELSQEAFERMSVLGAVVHVDCVGSRRVIRRIGQACAVRTTMVGMATTRR